MVGVVRTQRSALRPSLCLFHPPTQSLASFSAVLCSLAVSICVSSNSISSQNGSTFAFQLSTMRAAANHWHALRGLMGIPVPNRQFLAVCRSPSGSPAFASCHRNGAVAAHAARKPVRSSQDTGFLLMTPLRRLLVIIASSTSFTVAALAALFSSRFRFPNPNGTPYPFWALDPALGYQRPARRGCQGTLDRNR